MAVMTNIEFVEKAKKIANEYKTLYVMGCFGAPMNARNKTRYCNNNAYNRQPARTKMIKNATADTFGFDCVCLIKALLWGWCGDKNKTYGGATYCSNGVPDIGADTMIKVCSDVSSNFNDIVAGEVVWLQGHIGIYIGDGLAVECTPAWQNRVQITAVSNIGKKVGYNHRKWTKHGKLPYIDYKNTTQWTEGTYQLLKEKYVRKTPIVNNNRFKVKELTTPSEDWNSKELKMLVSQKPNDYAKFKKGVVLQITKISKEGKNTWGKYGSYGSDWVCLCDSTGPQSKKL